LLTCRLKAKILFIQFLGLQQNAWSMQVEVLGIVSA